jgi:hypothetical protein
LTDSKRENRVIRAFSGDNVDGMTNIIPKMWLGRLLDGYRSIMKQIYSPKIFYQRVRIFFKELRVPAIRSPMEFQRFLAIIRSGFWLGVWGKERLQYWHLLLWTLIRKPRLLSLAVTLAIYGHHFRRICEKYIFFDTDGEVSLE